MSDPSPTATAPGTRRPRRLHPRHAVYAALLAVVVVCVVVLYQKAAEDDGGLDSTTIQRLMPVADAKVLQQETIGIDLAPGYEGTLALNGVAIPEDQLTLVPELNQVMFQPGPGKDHEVLPPGRNCLVATYWLSSAPGQTTSYPWCFTVL